ncbi:MAG: aminotransferase class V-fold PLP-dependent enzyme [Oceanicoccus sp.]
MTSANALIDTIRSNLIGDRTLIPTAFGEKPLIYADYTASGRSLNFIEDYIRQRVLPYYANTHTETSYTGAHTTALREQSRQIIRQAVNCTEEDQVIFCGPGATAAINKLIDILNLRLPAELTKRYQLLEQIPADQRPVVFIGGYEHHSNELPWRESIADVEVIPLNQQGQLDIRVLQQKLQEYQQRSLLIGSFSAASNVTGIKTDTNRVSALLHQYGAMVLWDYAAAAPYVGIDMNSQSNHGDSSKDAVFISPHKFVGGPGTPGILVVKKHLLTNSVPVAPGGGTVLYVTPEGHRFVDNHELREEGGTPAIVESIRAGLVFKLQQDIGTDEIERKEEDFVKRALAYWQPFDNIEILGNTEVDRLSIMALRIKHQDKDLHYGFVVALLNDLFGIQARGGCSCAGPYGHSLLNMDMNYSKALEAEIVKGRIILRPGWVRLNFNYFIDEENFTYLLKAVALIAEHGWRLLPYYCFDTTTGSWRYQNSSNQLTENMSHLNFTAIPNEKPASVYQGSLETHLFAAKGQLLKCRQGEQRHTLALPKSSEELRWFALPQHIEITKK